MITGLIKTQMVMDYKNKIETFDPPALDDIRYFWTGLDIFGQWIFWTIWII